MMKKLLVLSLVLVMASLAPAAMTLVTDYDGSAVEVGSTINFQLSAGPYGAFQGDNWAVITDAGTVQITSIVVASLTNTVVGDVENNSSIHNPEGTVGLWGTTLWSNFAAGMPQQVIYNGVLTVGKTGVVSLYAPIVADAALPEAVGSFDVVVVPEPATLALLGLGVLALRRKK